MAWDESNTENALTLAIGKSRKDVLLLLLDRGADINTGVGKHGTILAVAACTESMDIVSLLLDRGADINLVGGMCGTALVGAVSVESTDIVTLLLDRGADINLVGGMVGTALAAAAAVKRTDIVTLLLDRGADINLVGGMCGTALAGAVSVESTDIVTLLLDRGADVNLVGGIVGTALAAAAAVKRTDIITLLLDRGADINLVGGMYGTALAGAVSVESKDIVTLLLDRGADINLVGGIVGTALAAAAYKERTDIVTLLLDRGADINLVGGMFGTALATAAYKESTDIVTLLLDRGADINLVSGIHGTALAAAATTDIVSLLLDRGADINMVGGMCGTALATAVLGGSTAIVLLLLDRGADINVVGGICGTALATAAFSGNTSLTSSMGIMGIHGRRDYGNTDVASLLFDKVTNVNSMEEFYEGMSLLADINKPGDISTALGPTALKLATGRGSTEIASLLLYRGADINLVGCESGTALGQAVYKGHTEIAMLLLECGADVMRVGGSSSAALGVYPSVLDVARSEGSRADSTLLARLTAAINNQTNQPTDPLSRPPFPMPYTWQHSASYTDHHKHTLPPCLNAFSRFHADGNIAPEQADIPCQDLTDNEEVLRSLTALVGLNEDTTQAKRQWIQNDFRYFAACRFDFGLAYAAARVSWKHFNDPSLDSNLISIQRSQWHKHAQALDQVRSNAITIDVSNYGQELITSPYSIMPRRLWDLKSNRVVDFRMLNTAPSTKSVPAFWAVSHSWTSEMLPVWTAINQYQWPVPCPKGINLDNLRSELLAFGAEYVWLDIICLRQQSEVDCLEQLRRKEWKLDVPTIGNIYRAATIIVRYFNGLGVRFSNRGWEDARHWLQRAWTLQEIATESITINGGVPWDQGQVLLDSEGEVSGKVMKLRSAIRPVMQLAAQVDSPQGCELYRLAQEMAKRYASQPVDKISGLFYLLRTTKLLCYNETMTDEDFWRQSFHLLPVERKAEILFDFPYRGLYDQWFPTWAQVLKWPTRNQDYDHMRYQGSPNSIRNIPGKTALFIGNTWTMPHVVLHEADNSCGYKVKTNNRLFGFYSPYLSQQPIDVQGQPTFTLAIAELGHAYNWLVCIAVDKLAGTDIGLEVAEVNVLKKVGVIRTDYCGELLVSGLLQKVDCLFV